MMLRFGSCAFVLAIALAPVLAVQPARTDSVFSANGVGVEVDQASLRSRALGGAEIAALDPEGFPGRNPAGVLASDGPGVATSYVGQWRELKPAAGERTTVTDGRIDYLRLIVPVSPKTGLAFGLTPLTRVSFGTRYDQTVTLGGMPTHLDIQWHLHGGLSEAALDIARRLSRRLIVGLRVGSVFGPLKEKWELSASGGTTFTSAESELLREHLGLRVKFGAIAELAKGLTAGAIYVPQVDINQRRRINKVAGERLLAKGTFEMPAEWGLGAALVAGFWEVRADVSQTRWAGAENPESQLRFRNTMALATGIQRRLRQRGLVVGIGYRQRELYVLHPGETRPRTERFITWGVGFRSPEREGKGRFGIDIAAEYGVRDNEGGLTERALRPAVSFALWP